ncbi:Clp protease N-terminal domain-containing protein [Actinopolymorpha alba]|uniref:Clp protease N-terminal domain-containing protein n=1 Tax=Actinopolymorpha alba TaxID=533267 RepID=UPI00037C481C|nr:Clp protease N-terminal domain-containing protein [Actinopolymorpha alba]
MTDRFERYTADARKAVEDAEDEARVRSQGHVGTEHLLLGLLSRRARAFRTA